MDVDEAICFNCDSLIEIPDDADFITRKSRGMAGPIIETQHIRNYPCPECGEQTPRVEMIEED